MKKHMAADKEVNIDEIKLEEQFGVVLDSLVTASVV
jgi:hypothetical protein